MFNEVDNFKCTFHHAHGTLYKFNLITPIAINARPNTFVDILLKYFAKKGYFQTIKRLLRSGKHNITKYRYAEKSFKKNVIIFK